MANLQIIPLSKNGSSYVQDPERQSDVCHVCVIGIHYTTLPVSVTGLLLNCFDVHCTLRGKLVTLTEAYNILPVYK